MGIRKIQIQNWASGIFSSFLKVKNEKSDIEQDLGCV
jgi:hypothetical protein